MTVSVESATLPPTTALDAPVPTVARPLSDWLTPSSTSLPLVLVVEPMYIAEPVGRRLSPAERMRRPSWSEVAATPAPAVKALTPVRVRSPEPRL